MLLVDLSRSENFGTAVAMKNEIATEICAVLAFSAIRNNESRAHSFSEKIEKFIPPKGKAHILRMCAISFV